MDQRPPHPLTLPPIESEFPAHVRAKQCHHTLQREACLLVPAHTLTGAPFLLLPRLLHFGESEEVWRQSCGMGCVQGDGVVAPRIGVGPRMEFDTEALGPNLMLILMGPKRPKKTCGLPGYGHRRPAQ